MGGGGGGGGYGAPHCACANPPGAATSTVISSWSSSWRYGLRPFVMRLRVWRSGRLALCAFCFCFPFCFCFKRAAGRLWLLRGFGSPSFDLATRAALRMKGAFPRSSSGNFGSGEVCTQRRCLSSECRRFGKRWIVVQSWQ